MSVCIVKIKANWHTAAAANANELMGKEGRALGSGMQLLKGVFYRKSCLDWSIVFYTMIQTSSAPCRSGGRREWQRVRSVGKWVETSYKMTLNLAPFQFFFFFPSQQNVQVGWTEKPITYFCHHYKQRAVLVTGCKEGILTPPPLWPGVWLTCSSQARKKNLPSAWSENFGAADFTKGNKKEGPG